MSTSKANLILLPLLVSILLSVAGKLKVGPVINNVVYLLFSPISQPVNSIRQIKEEKFSLISSLPDIQHKNQILILQNASLVTENEVLKQMISDKKMLSSAKLNFKDVLPVRLTGASNNYTVTSSQPLENVKQGQPLISGSIILGFVSEINGSIITIAPLDDAKITPFSIHTSSGQKGQYKYISQVPQITDIPSQNSISLGDNILTEPTELIPGNLLVGKTIKILTSSQEPLQKAEVSLEATISTLSDSLFLVLKP